MNLSEIIKSTSPKFSDIVPSTNKKIWFRPFLVKEEKLLLIAQEMGSEQEILKCISEVLQSCFEEIGDVSKIPLFDLEYLFIKLRCKSVQELATPILICPVTGEEVTLKINLEEIEVIKDSKHSKTLKISDNLIIGMKYPSLSLFLNSNIESMELSDFYDLAVNCVDYIETRDEKILSDSVSKEEIKDFIDNMTKQQFDMIINFFSTMPRVEKTVKYITSDKEIRSITLRGIKDFFGLASATQT